jgi:hypothetical protein
VARLTGISPVLPVASIERSVATPYRFREFGVQGPDGRDIAIGERLRS